jgi:hypothetical protein
MMNRTHPQNPPMQDAEQIHTQPSPGLDADAAFYAAYMPLAQFSAMKHCTPEAVLAFIKAGSCSGYHKQGAWFVARSEMSQPWPPAHPSPAVPKDARPSNIFLLQLIRGQFGLPATFWVFGVFAGPFVLPITAALVGAFEQQGAIAAMIALLSASYFVLVLIGTFNAADHYTASEGWAITAKIASLLMLGFMAFVAFVIYAYSTGAPSH